MCSPPHTLITRDIPEDISADIDWDGDCEDTVVTGLTCVGIVGIQDPVRPEVCVYSDPSLVPRPFCHDFCLTASLFSTAVRQKLGGKAWV